MVNDKNLSRAGVFFGLLAAMFFGAWLFGSAWNASIASYFGLRKMTYSEALGVLHMVSMATITLTFTVKLFRDD